MGLDQALSQVAKEVRADFEFIQLALRNRVRASAHSRRKVLVNGCPKSGTTWMLKLITSVPGYRGVGNFNGDRSRYLNLQFGDVVHGHDPYGEELWTILESAGVKVVLMVRDPKDQAVSRAFHAIRDSSHPFHAAIKQMSLDEAIHASIRGEKGLRGVMQSIEFTTEWLESGADIGVVHYEALSEAPVGEFQGVLEFLGIDISEELTELIVERNRFQKQTTGKRIWRTGRRPGEEDRSPHFRKGIVGDWQNYFTESHLRQFNEIAHGHLERIGYEDTPAI